MKLNALLLLSSVGAAAARYAANLNYGSPSAHHPFLGISLYKVVRRHDTTVRSIDASALNFTHGVASGDPYAESVILWTRISPEYDNDKSNVTVSGTVPLFNHDMQEYVRVSTAPVCVNYKVATDRKMEKVVHSGQAYTSSDIDWTIKVEATGLKPFTQYYYQFTVCDSNNASPVGRTKTAPAPDDDVSELSVAVYSCSNYPFGYFNAFGNSVRKDSVDYVLHLGDFIYEYAEGAYGWGWAIDRISQPNKEIRSLYDYRRRHASYRADFDAILSFASYAWIPVWDDHEVGDNTWRDGMADHNNTEDSFIQDGLQEGGDGLTFDQRKMNAVRAYFEWMPIRQVEMDDNLRIWRTFSLGNLADIIMLDTRQYDRSVTDLYWNNDYIHEIQNDAGRSLMGSRQENWFYKQLSKSKNRGATWRLIGSQIVFSRLNQSTTGGADDPYNMDAWDGYQANRNRTFQHLYNNNITNNILMAGDSHMSWVSDLVWLGEHDYDPKTGAGSVGVEFSGSAVSSPCPHGQNITIDKANKNSAALVAGNRELLWQDMYYRGYYELTLSHDAVHAKYFGVPTLVQRTPLEVSLANFTVLRDANAVKRPIAGGVVESGALKFGEVMQTNLTYNTATGKYAVHNLSTFGYNQIID
ncbi:Alkaline phosphatase D-related protein [Lasiodiplodia theobromae]|nr:Alkaline phosphatase D-related protein [Lasiodiplodia theobromae]